MVYLERGDTMKRYIFLSVLCMFFANAMYAQLTKSQEGYLERKIAEAEAKQKKSVEAEKEKEREKERKKEQRHEQQRRQHEAQFNRQMNNLNSVSAEDYMTGQKQQTGGKGFQATTSKQGGSPTTPVANKRKTTNLSQTRNNNGSNSNRSRNTGSLINSGGNYTGDRYAIKPAGFGNTQQQAQVRKSANEYRYQYTMRQPKGKPNGNPVVTNLRRQQTAPKVSVQSYQASNQQNPQHVGNVQAQQQKPVQKKVWMENGKLVLDTSKGPIYSNLQQSYSSPDLARVDTRRIDYSTEIGNTTVYNLPEEAYHLSDRNNKITSANVKQIANDEKTQASLYQKMRQDALDGFSSFENRQKWEDIYDFGYHRTVTTSRTVTKKRN